MQDEDGDFLLIEAAQSLPDWMDPEVMKNRFFLWQCHFHVISAAVRFLSAIRRTSRVFSSSFCRAFISYRPPPKSPPPSSPRLLSEWSGSGKPFQRTPVSVWFRGDGNVSSIHTAGLPPIFAASTATPPRWSASRRMRHWRNCRRAWRKFRWCCRDFCFCRR